MKTPFAKICSEIKKTEGNLKVIEFLPRYQKLWAKVNSFEGLETSDELEKLDISGLEISTFAFCNPQPNLKDFICKRTQLRNLKNLEIMALICFGNSLETINKRDVLPRSRDIANTLRPKLQKLITDNWLLVDLNPVRLIHAETRKRKVMYIELPPEDTQIDPEQTENQNAQENDSNKKEQDKKGDDKSVTSSVERAKANALTRKEVRDIFRDAFERVIEKREIIRSNKDPKTVKRQKKALQKKEEEEEKKRAEMQVDQNFALTSDGNESGDYNDVQETGFESPPPPQKREKRKKPKTQNELFGLTEDTEVQDDERIKQKAPPKDSDDDDDEEEESD